MRFKSSVDTGAGLTDAKPAPVCRFLLRHIFTEAFVDRRDLTARGAALRVEDDVALCVRRAADEARADRPRKRRLRVVVEHDRELLAGNGAVRAEALARSGLFCLVRQKRFLWWGEGRGCQLGTCAGGGDGSEGRAAYKPATRLILVMF